MPLDPGLLPVLVPLALRAGRDEELHLHLLELPHAEDELAGDDLVPEGLADLRDAERQLHAAGLLDVEEVDEDALRRLRAEVDDPGVATDRAELRLEHQVELAHIRPVGRPRLRVLDAQIEDELLHRVEVVRIHGGLEPRIDVVDLSLTADTVAVGGQELLLVEGVAEALLRLGHVLGNLGFDLADVVLDQDVRAVALLAVLVVDQRVVERIDVSRGLPRGGVHENAGVKAHDVLVHPNHRGPPVSLDVVLQLHPELPIVIGGTQSIVDVAGGEHEAVFLGVSNHALEVVVLLGHGQRSGKWEWDRWALHPSGPQK